MILCNSNKEDKAEIEYISGKAKQNGWSYSSNI